MGVFLSKIHPNLGSQTSLTQETNNCHITERIQWIHIMCKLPYFCIFKFLNKRKLVRWNSVEGDLGGSDEEGEKTSSGKAWDCGDCSLEA